MKKSRYTDEQIAFALKVAETGTPVAEVIRRMGISEQTFYPWKKVNGGLGIGELRRVKQLEDENRKLKQLVAASAGRICCCRGCPSGRMNAGYSPSGWMRNRGTLRAGGHCWIA
jgi:putative transposase